MLAKNESQPAYRGLFSTIGRFSKIIFDYVWAIYAINTRIGVIHGDLHLNNATVYRYYALYDRDGNLIVDNPVVKYTIDDKTWTFPYVGCYGMLIDFSRGIISTNHVKNTNGEYASGILADTEQSSQYFKEQRNRILKMLNQYFPTFMKSHKDKVLSLLIDNFDLAFKIISAVDIYSLTTNITNMLELEFEKLNDEKSNKNGVELIPEIKKLMSRIGKRSEELLLDGLNGAISKKITDIGWPAYTIMNEFFSDFASAVNANDNGDDKNVNNYKETICDSWYYNNDLSCGIVKQDTAEIQQVQSIVGNVQTVSNQQTSWMFE